MKTENQAWQLCPKCNGSKQVNYTAALGTTTVLLIQCDICMGHGIISCLTGQPPGMNIELKTECRINETKEAKDEQATE